MTNDLKLTIRDIKTRAVVAPIARPLATRIGTFNQIPLLLIDLETEEGVTGRTYLFGYTKRGFVHMAGMLVDILDMTKGRLVAPTTLWGEVLKGLTLMGHQGVATMALSGFDMACWDALGQAAGVPLARLLGGEPRPIRAYNSNGLGLGPIEEVGAEAAALVADGNFSAIKLRVGRDTLAEDLASVQAVRDAVGDDIILPCDYNQGLTIMQAIERGQALDLEDMYWIEEPIVYDDLAGYAKIAAEVATPITLGENFFGPRAMADAIAAEAGDYMMPDIQRIGGVTGWLRAATLAESAGIEMSSHLFPEVSAHMLAVTPTAHWLEYVNWAAPVLAEPIAIEDGFAIISDRPGSGIAWNEDAVARYAVEI